MKKSMLVSPVLKWVGGKRQLLDVRDVPPGYLPVSSSTGQASPTQLLIAPAVENGEVFAVIELGFYRPVSDAERSLLERASEMLAVAIRSGIDRNRLQELLEETQRLESLYQRKRAALDALKQSLLHQAFGGAL